MMGACAAITSSQRGASMAGASGSAMIGSPLGTPSFIVDHASSLPTKASFASLCSRICRTDSALDVGYRGTVT